MYATKPPDWPDGLPAKKTTIRLDRTFSPQEMTRIRRGFVPDGMDDRWFIYWRDDFLYFHRSWTGFCIYIVRFAVDGGRMIEADVNRDPEQYTETNDKTDSKMISRLIDQFLLHP
jgi:hypothetical protein